MKIFAPVPLSYERATGDFGLASGTGSFNLRLAGVDGVRFFPRDRGVPFANPEAKPGFSRRRCRVPWFFGQPQANSHDWLDKRDARPFAKFVHSSIDNQRDPRCHRTLRTRRSQRDLCACRGLAPGRHSHPHADRGDRRSSGQSRSPGMDTPPSQSPVRPVAAPRTNVERKAI